MKLSFMCGRRFVIAAAIVFACLWAGEVWLAPYCAVVSFCTVLPHTPLILLMAIGIYAGIANRQKLAIAVYSVLFIASFVWSGFNIPIPADKCGDQFGREGGSLRLASFNAFHLNYGDKKVRSMLTRTGADIICLQEIGEERVDRNFYPDTKDDWNRAWTWELMVLSKYPIIWTKRLELSDPSIQSRPALAVRVKAPHGHITIVDTHWTVIAHPYWLEKAKTGGCWSQVPSWLSNAAALREYQAKKMIAMLKELEGPVVIAGDFNGGPGDPAFKMLMNFWGKDAFPAAGWGFGNTYTFGTRFPMMRLDHIIVPEGWRVSFCAPIPGIASDHRPLVADFHPFIEE
ncbi:MAG: endonuclease/exonuclease/phosphatase family protein [bacterium]|nr:endonuclease/exonuclease/phosphatase family protein [bacterium]